MKLIENAAVVINEIELEEHRWYTVLRVKPRHGDEIVKVIGHVSGEGVAIFDSYDEFEAAW